MEIVINLSREDYTKIVNSDNTDVLHEAVRDGIWLPEKHGKLIDAKDLLTHQFSVREDDYDWIDLVNVDDVYHAEALVDATEEDDE